MDVLRYVLGVSPWKETRGHLWFFHIKAETAIGAVLPPVPNFLSPQHTLVPPFVGKSTSVFSVHGKLQVCCSTDTEIKGDMETYWTHWARQMMQCRNNLPPVSHSSPTTSWKKRAQFSHLSSMKEGSEFIIRVNGWGKKRHKCSFCVCVLSPWRGTYGGLLVPATRAKALCVKESITFHPC